MKGTVKSIVATANGYSATVSRTDPPPQEDVIISDVPTWARSLLETALAGGKDVEILPNDCPEPTNAPMTSVKVSS